MGNISLVVVGLLAGCTIYVSISAEDTTDKQGRGLTEVLAGAQQCCLPRILPSSGQISWPFAGQSHQSVRGLLFMERRYSQGHVPMSSCIWCGSCDDEARIPHR